MIYRVFLVLCFSTITFGYKPKYDQSISEKDALEIFRVDRNEDVPEYEIAHIESKTLENGRKILTMNVFGKKKTFVLEKVDHQHTNIPVLEVSRNEDLGDGYTFREYPTDVASGTAYQDKKNLAAFFMYPDSEGRISVEGTIGHGLALKPLSRELTEKILEANAELLRKKRSTAYSRPNDEVFLNGIDQDIEHDVNIATGKRILDDSVFHKHVIYKMPHLAPKNHTSDYVFIKMDEDDDQRRKRSLRSKRQIPKTVYIDTLVFVDHITYKAFGENKKKIKRYQQSFWNAVDLRFHSLTAPKVRLNLVGVVVAKDAEGVPFIAENMVTDDMVDANRALDDMSKYLYHIKDRIKTDFDIAVTVTTIDICSGDSSNICQKPTTGLAYVAGACIANLRSKKICNAGLVEDSGGYSGVMTAAHEVGHLLGAVHDGEPSPHYENLPGAESCSFRDGYIMSYLHTKNSFRWSPCSINTFHQFLRGDGATCVYNAPRKEKKMETLPGRLMSLDEQCRMDRGTKACFKDYRVCTQLFCYNQGSTGSCTAFRPAVDGSWCGKGQHCIAGKCVKRSKKTG